MYKLAPHMLLYPCYFPWKVEVKLEHKGSTHANMQLKQGEASFHLCRYLHVTVEQLE